MKDPRFAKFVVFVNALVPLALLVWDAAWHQLGANPVMSAIHTTGLMAIIFLLLSLVVTPLRMITGKNWYSNFRRMLGLYAFFYACLHVSIYFAFDRQFNLLSLIKETYKRPFILYGMSALLLMLPLAITSTNGMIKRLGAAKWKRLHQLVYASGILAVIHYLMFSKLISYQQIAFAVVLGLLLGYRLAAKFGLIQKKKPAAPARKPAVTT